MSILKRFRRTSSADSIQVVKPEDDKRRRIIKCFLIVGVFICAYAVLVPTLVLRYGRSKVYLNMESVEGYEVGIVFGAGIKADGTPQDMLKDRLIVAADLYRNQKINKILVSGDNRFEDYNEPQVMYDYLVNVEKIEADDVYRDFAGRRTYDTCIRAKQIWGIEKAILISQGYHLSRAIFTCNTLGIESEGYSGTLQDYIGDSYYKFREILAIHNSILELFVFPPSYVGGKMEADLTQVN